MYEQFKGLRRKSISLAFIAMLVFTALLAFQFSPTVAAAKTHYARTQSVPLTQSITLRRGYYDYYEVDSFSSNTSVAYSVLSSAPISTALMTSAQLNEFGNSSNDPISNSVTYVNGTSVQNNVTIASGKYFLVFYAYYSRANIEFGFQVSPNTPFSYGSLSTPLSSGIAAFGIANNSGAVTSYEIRTNEIVGTANISSFQVNTPNAVQYGVSITGCNPSTEYSAGSQRQQRF